MENQREHKLESETETVFMLVLHTSNTGILSYIP